MCTLKEPDGRVYCGSSELQNLHSLKIVFNLSDESRQKNADFRCEPILYVNLHSFSYKVRDSYEWLLAYSITDKARNFTGKRFHRTVLRGQPDRLVLKRGQSDCLVFPMV